jgi:uncharacterized membrane protein (UPF0127 family)
VIGKMGDLTSGSTTGKIAGLSAISTVLSNLVSNVPAVMLLKPYTEALGQGHLFWLTLAMSSTLAGNLTLVGSVANLIVAQQARRRIEIGFMEYFRVGALITVITIAAGILVLAVEVRVAKGDEPVRSSEFGARSAAAKTKAGKTLSVIPADGSQTPRTFHVVLLCDTTESRTRGLQGFRQLAPGEAALFVFPKPEIVTFWMGSVSFPIDILFVAKDGTVVQAYLNLRPGSLDYYPSREPVRSVIETAAGSGVRIGDKIRIERSRFGLRKKD